jgi:hypothetical protein
MWWRRIRYVLALVGLCAIATFPAAKRSCTARSHAREADQLLDYLDGRVTEIVVSSGKLPRLAAGPTPQPACCEQGGTCDPDASVWDTPGWRALGFSIDGPFRYTYSYTPDATGSSAVLRAIGDLECNGETTSYEIKLTLDGGKLSHAWTGAHPRE